MKRVWKICSLMASLLLVTTSYVSVVGYQPVHENNTSISSPLFSIRTDQATQRPSKVGRTTFLGKGAELAIFPARTANNQEMLQTALKIFGSKPDLVNTLLDKIQRYPAIAELLEKHNIKTSEIPLYIKMIQHNPLVLSQAIADIQDILPETDDPQPLGLSTSNPLGCVIVAIFVFVPLVVTLLLLLLLFTLRILTCMNVNDCANDIANNIWSQLIQGLTQE